MKAARQVFLRERHQIFHECPPKSYEACWMSASPPIVLDVRTRAHFAEEDGQIPGSIRVLPDQISEWMAHAGAAVKEHVVVAYCT